MHGQSFPALPQLAWSKDNLRKDFDERRRSSLAQQAWSKGMS
jgi:hypothetical protein